MLERNEKKGSESARAKAGKEENVRWKNSPTQTKQGAKDTTMLYNVQAGIQSVIGGSLNHNYVHRRKNPAAMAARMTVTPDLAAEAAPLPDRLLETPVAVEVGVGTLVLVVVMLDGLAGS